MIFAAGLGTRLAPITTNKPKALAPFCNTTLLGYNLHSLSKQGITEFVINIHHFADTIIEYLEENKNFGLKIHLSHEQTLLDTAGGLAYAAKYFTKNEDILLYNVDVISNIDIIKMYDFHAKYKALATLATQERETSRYLLFDNDNQLLGWRNKKTKEELWCREKNKAVKEKAFSGIHWINTNIINNLEMVKLSMTPLYLEKAKNETIISYDHNENYWFDCGKIESLKAAEKFVSQL